MQRGQPLGIALGTEEGGPLRPGGGEARAQFGIAIQRAQCLGQRLDRARIGA